MRKSLWSVLFAAATLLTPSAHAAHSHYTNGVEGAKAASLPPPGFYVRMYNAYYTAGTYKDNDGRKYKDTAVDVYAQVARAILMTDKQLFGANWGMDLALPVANTQIVAGRGSGGWRAKYEDFGVGDILFEPLILSWNRDRFDAVVAGGVYLPTGEFDLNKPSKAGRDHYTFMATAGATVYLDCAKTWSVALLARYETHTPRHADRMRIGDDLHFEWGVSKSFSNGLWLGVAGYAQWQLEHDRTARGVRADDGKERLAALGPEIGFTIPCWKMDVSLKSIWEVYARNAFRGSITTLAMTRAF